MNRSFGTDKYKSNPVTTPPSYTNEDQAAVPNLVLFRRLLPRQSILPSTHGFVKARDP